MKEERDYKIWAECIVNDVFDCFEEWKEDCLEGYEDLKTSKDIREYAALLTFIYEKALTDIKNTDSDTFEKASKGTPYFFVNNIKSLEKEEAGSQ